MPPKAPPVPIPPLLNRIPRDIAGQPAPFIPTEPVQDALLPWLAMGWTPVFTRSGGGSLCGYYALRDSMVAAMDFFRLPGRRPTVEGLQGLQASPRFGRRVDNYLGGLPDELPREDVARLRAALMESNNLESESLRILLELANEEFRTNFDLGVITEGYRVRFERRATGESGFNENFVAPTGVQQVTAHRNRPTIWIWNDGADQRRQAHEPDLRVETTPHWESFGPPLASRPGQASRQRLVRNWNLGEMTRTDIEAGVYMVTEEIQSYALSPKVPSSPGSSPAPPDAGTFAHIGHFVRPEIVPSAIDVPADHIYVRLCRSTSNAPGAEVRTVPMASLQRVVLHESAPEPGLDPQGASDPSSWRDVPAKAMSTGIGPQVPFQIVRRIALANKIGGAIEDEQGPNFDAIDGFNTAIGDFFLDSLMRPNELATVTNIAGIQGNVQLRKLQELKRPWGWLSERVALLDSLAQAVDIVSGVNAQPPRIGDVDIPSEFYRIVLSDKSTYGAMTVNAGKSKKQALRPLLEALGGGKGPKGQVAKADIIREIQGIIAGSADVKLRTRAIGSLTLPLYTLNIAIPATRTQRTPFLAGEVVRLWDNAQNRAGNVRILDYEGHDASISLDQLTAIGTAFGLVLDEAHAPDEFRTNGKALEPLVPRISTNQRPTKRQPGDNSAGRSASSNYRADPEIIAQLANLDPHEADDIIRTTAEEAGCMTANVNIALRVGTATLKRGPEAVRRSSRVKRQKVKSE